MNTTCCSRPPFEELASPVLKDLTTMAVGLTRDVASAEDLVQETLLKAYKAYGRFEPGSNFKAWAQRILYNTFVSQFRRRREQPLPDGDDAAQSAPVPDLTSADLDRISERLDDRLKQAIARMNPDFREVFLRAAIDDATNEEIARALNIPVGTVMSRLGRARAFLRHELADSQ